MTATAISTAAIMMRMSLRHADRGDDRIDREDDVDHDHLEDDEHEGAAADRGRLMARRPPSPAASISACISWVALAIRNRPPPIRMMSCQEIDWPNIVTSGSDRPTSQVSVNSSRMRKTSASDRPRRRACVGLRLGQARHQDGDEHDIVDAEHDLERAQRDERGPGMRIGQKIEHAPRQLLRRNAPPIRI